MDAPVNPQVVVLLVDDDVTVTRLLARMLREDGYGVETLVDGAGAIARLANGARPDVLVIDYRLPHADGLAVASYARARFPGIPVIVITSWAELVAKSATILTPPPVVLGKPLVYSDLKREIAQATRTG